MTMNCESRLGCDQVSTCTFKGIYYCKKHFDPIFKSSYGESLESLIAKKILPFEKVYLCGKANCRNRRSSSHEFFCPQHFEEWHKKHQEQGEPAENELPKVMQDQLDVSPLHYRKGEIEPWDFCISQNMGGLEFNIIKYISRYKYKDGIKDLKKAKTYLEKLILTEQQKTKC